jgi:hypothetical protein
MQQFLYILTFYKPFILWSFLINIAILIVNSTILSVIITKLLLIIFLWFFITETSAKRKLTIYNSLGISTLKLFSALFLIDFIFTISFLSIIKEFI